MAAGRGGLNVFHDVFRQVVVCRVNRGRSADKVDESGVEVGFAFDALGKIDVVVIFDGVNDFQISVVEIFLVYIAGPSGAASDEPSGVVAESGTPALQKVTCGSSAAATIA